MRLLVAIAALQAFFWLVMVPTIVLPGYDSPPLVEVEDFTFAAVAAPGADALPDADYQPAPREPLNLPVGYYAVRSTFTLDEVPEQGLAMLDQMSGDNMRLFANGQLFHAPGSMSLEEPSYHAYQREVLLVPPSTLREGENEITGIYLQTLPHELNFHPPVLGEYVALSDAARWRAFTIEEYRLITAVMVFVVTLFAGLAALRARDRDLPKWLFLAGAGWTAYNLFFEWLWLPLVGPGRGFYYGIATIFLAMAWAVFADAWSGKRLRLYRPAVFAVFGTGALTCFWAMFIAYSDTAFNVVETAVEWAGLTLAFATVARLVWHFATQRDERRYIEAAALVLLASMMAYHLITIILYDVNRPYLSATQPLVLLLLVIGFFQRNFALFRSREQLNEELAGQLAERTQELAVAHEREKGLLRDQARVEERRRIMRDMHDGIGSSLMSLLLGTRSGRMDSERMALGLQAAIDEMRLMIDSMDSMGDNLQTAFALFCERARRRCDDAGFAFACADDSGDNLPPLGARDILQVFRVLQEAVTNALKHSSGDRISARLLPDSVEIRDNGQAFKGPRQGGRGLENMEVRAQSIGATLTVDREGEETVVRLALPPAAAG
ncbi:sensor histidine kinase [Aurantiacibacter gilvus]|uniref:histidine kinase n=1 Tax=Aurantiacibacter gilvus TaxID=3139141 RepID=A0ABU9IGL5_9SPHN